MQHKQHPSKQIQRYRNLMLSIGLLISLAMILLAFEYKVIHRSPEQVFLEDTNFDLPIIPITINEPPKPPETKAFELIPVDEPEAVTPENVVIDIDYDINKVIEEVKFLPQDKDEKTEEFFIVLENEAAFPGGNEAWMQFLNSNFNYPRKAARMGIEGRVFLQFTVDVDGSLSNIEVIRGIGGGCDEEALRVLKKSPNWNPGKQRGRPVKSRRTISIVFRLN